MLDIGFNKLIDNIPIKKKEIKIGEIVPHKDIPNKLEFI
jgi:hypothetical protein